MNVNELYNYIIDSARKRQIGNIKTSAINDRMREGSLFVFKSRYGIPQQYQAGRPIANMSFELTRKIKDDLKNFTVYNSQINLYQGYFPYPSDYLHTVSVKIRSFTNSENCGINGEKRWEAVDVIDHDKEVYRLTSKIITSPFLLQAEDGYVAGRTDAQVMLLTYLRWPKAPYWDYDIINGQMVYVPFGETITNNPIYNYETLSLPRTSQSQDSEFPIDVDLEIAKFVLQAIGGETRDDKLYQESRAELAAGQ